MMSERKRKQTWSLNPRGKDWSENSNKFGQKLLEKMGWSAGKGLGANEDGMIDHIRVAYKNDTQGMGFKETDDQWTEHQSNFSKLLDTLGGSKNGEKVDNLKEPKIESLEKKSQISKARVHYHKFTRGKDLSRYSEKDLANIFGKKSLKDLAKPEEVNVEKEGEKENLETKSFGVVTHNGGNMLEYFKTKLPHLKKSTTVISTTDINNESESDIERPSFGLGFGGTGAQNQEKPKDQSEFIDKKTKKKKKVDETDNFRKPCFGLGYDRHNGNESKPKSTFTSFVKATDTVEKKEPIEYGVSGGFRSEKDKKQKEKKSTENTSETLADNERPTNGFGFNTSNIIKKHSSFMSFIKGTDRTDSPIENNEIEDKDVKKKHKKSRNHDDSHENDPDTTKNSEDGKKKKTKKIKKIESEISSMEVPSSDLGPERKKKEKQPTFVSFIAESDNVDDEDQTNKKKKNKKDKSKKEKANCGEVVDTNNTEENYVQNETITKKKKKSKKDKSRNEPNSDEVSENFNSEESVAPMKGKKRKSESELDVVFTPIKKKFKNFEDLHTLQDEERIVETPNKKKKKNKDSKNVQSYNGINKHQNGLANPGFDPLYCEITVQKHNLDAIVEEPDNIVESSPEQKGEIKTNSESITDENKSGMKKKKKSKRTEGIDNPCLEESYIMNETSQTIEDSVLSENPKKKKSKKSKKEKDFPSLGVANSAFDEHFKEDDIVQENNDKYEIKGKKRKREANEAIIEDTANVEKKKKNKIGSNEMALENTSSTQETSQTEEIVGETPSKIKKRKKKDMLSIENPGFNSDDSFISLEVTPNKYEVKRSKKDKNLGIVNPGLDLTSPPSSGVVQNGSMIDELPVMDDNLMLNVVCTPIMKKDNDKKLQRRKSVRFSDINQSIFINKLDSPADLIRNGDAGLDNAAYDQLGNRIEENIDTLNKQLDDYQAEVENDINEAKMQVMIGEVGDPSGENEALPSGEVKLKFKYANFGRMPPWMNKSKALSNPKSSYRHLIKGDIVLGFKNTNMHNIKGYNEHLKECSP